MPPGMPEAVLVQCRTHGNSSFLVLQRQAPSAASSLSESRFDFFEWCL
jgi:hypothetical protein